jgi:hypothetical protein
MPFTKYENLEFTQIINVTGRGLIYVVDLIKNGLADRPIKFCPIQKGDKISFSNGKRFEVAGVDTVATVAGFGPVVGIIVKPVAAYRAKYLESALEPITEGCMALLYEGGEALEVFEVVAIDGEDASVRRDTGSHWVVSLKNLRRVRLCLVSEERPENVPDAFRESRKLVEGKYYVIGEVSPDAKWVREGAWINEQDYFPDHTHHRRTEEIVYTRLEGSPWELLLIRCTCCDTFK